MKKPNKFNIVSLKDENAKLKKEIKRRDEAGLTWEKLNAILAMEKSIKGIMDRRATEEAETYAKLESQRQLIQRYESKIAEMSLRINFTQ